MAEQDVTQEQAQAMWDEEANPAQETATEEPPQEEAKPEAPQSEPVQDPFAGLPDVVKQKLAQIDQLAQANQQLMQHVRSAEGRVAAMQRELAVKPTPQQAAAAVQTPEKWAQFAKDFPEIAESTEEFINARLQSVGQGLTQEQVAQIVQQQVATTRAEMGMAIEEAKIESRFPDWRKQINTPVFLKWFSTQPQKVRVLANSTSAKDALQVLDLFDKSTQQSPAEVKQQRVSRLAAAATTKPNASLPAKTLDESDFQSVWEYEARQLEKRKAARGF